MADMDVGMTVGLIKALGSPDPAVIEGAVSDWLDDHPEATTTVEDGAISYSKLDSSLQGSIDDVGDLKTEMGDINTATSSAIGKALSPKTVTNGKVTEWQFKSIGGGTSADLYYVTPEEYGAVGDGVTDDSQAVQDACDAGYAVYFASGKTYYLASTVTIDHDCHLFGGEGATIKTKTPTGGTVNNAIRVAGTLKKTTTMTTDYTSNGNTDNCNNKFTLTDMTDIAIGDIMVITATDQHYNYARQYYYLGATLLITDIYDGHIYTSDSMPWDITNTANVSVEVYSAPTAIVENLKFMSDGFNGGNYRYLLSLLYCNGCVVKNCGFTDMPNGINVFYSVNTLINDVSLSKSKYDNSLTGDGYGIIISSCTNTIVERVMATCAQHAISISGQLPAINTYIRNCDLTAECRTPGLDTHEAVYNLVVEDCVLGTAALNSVCTINRCRVINNKRQGLDKSYISVYGSHNPEWSRIKILDTVFEGTGVYVLRPGVQDPVQAYDNIVGELVIKDCVGGELMYMAHASADILSNTINRLVIDNWTDVERIYHEANSGVVKKLEIRNTTFSQYQFINDNNPMHGIILDGIEQINWNNAMPELHKSSVNRLSRGEYCVLPEGVSIQLSSNNASAKFRVCGANITPNDSNDYLVGLVSGNDGADLVRTVLANTTVTLSIDGNGDLVQSQGNTANSCAIYPVGMCLVTEWSIASISATLKNTGNTDGAKYRFYIAVVDGNTGKIIERRQDGQTQASAEGTNLQHDSYVIKPGNVVLPYIYCSTAVANSETTFENLSMTITPIFAPPVVDEAYTAKRLTGDGTILSLPGVNNIMCSEDTFNVKFEADMAYNSIWSAVT